MTSQSGVNISYDGVTKTVEEVTGSAGGLAARTTTLTDSFGRLTEVRELAVVGGGTATNAVTQYTFGPDDNVVTVVDPQAVTTQLTHDFGGRRTQITRHGRTWKYGYDKNGNMISEQVPGSPTPPVTDPDYTTTIVYDALDRPTSKLIGARGMSAPDQTLFADRTEVYTWDTGGNMKGHLRWWVSYAPNSSTGTLKREMRRTDGDQNSYNALIFLGLDGLNATKATNTKFNLANLPTETRYYDQVAPSNHNTYGTVQYNARNLPSQILFNNVNSGDPLQTLAVQTRNVAGLVTKRRTNFTGSTNYVESNWTYDKLGRVVDQVVQKTPGPTQIARQQLTYLGNDNPSTLAHTIGSSAKSFTFGYDQRHQITSANETTTPGYFTSSYTYGLAGRFTGANLAQTAPGPGSELVPRNVTYQYADPDPERVTALINASNSSRFASYQYDDAGNQTSRCYGATFSPCTGESVEFLYDGKDQLRRATKRFNGVVQGSEEYWYDHEGARVAIVRRGANGVKTETVSFLGDTEAHYGSTNALDFIYTHLSLGTPVARLKRTSTGIELEHQFHGLASHTLAVVSSLGVTNAAFNYSPFGEVLETIDGGMQGTSTHRRRFNDKQNDQLSELICYGVRYFDAKLINWTQSDPKYRHSPDSNPTAPRRAALFMFSLSNPLRYYDPDGRDPQNYTIRIRDALPEPSPNDDANGKGLQMVAALIRAAASLTSSPGGHLDKLLSPNNRQASIHTMHGSNKAMSPANSSNIFLVDLKDSSSRNSAIQMGGASVTKLIDIMLKSNNLDNLARAERPGHNIVIAVDRIREIINKLGARDSNFDPSTAAGKQRIIEYLAERLAHEVGHNLGLSGEGRKEDEVMYEVRGLASQAYSRSRWTAQDISAVGDRFKQ